MKSSLLLLLLISCAFIVLESTVPSNFFDECDHDNSNNLDSNEIQSCYSVHFSHLAPGIGWESLFQFLDINHDELVSRKEYHKVVASINEQQNGDEDVLFRDRYGKESLLKYDDFFKLMEASMNQMPKGKNNVQEGTLNNNLTEIAKTNPEMARFIAIGIYAQDTLLSYNISELNGTMTQLRSLPNGGSKNRGYEATNELNFHKDSSFWIEMSIKPPSTSPSGRQQQLLHFEIHLERNSTIYPKSPHIGILNFWRLDHQGYRTKTIPLPTSDEIRKINQRQIYEKYKNIIVTVSATVACAALASIWLIMRRTKY